MAASYPIVPGVRFKEVACHPNYCVGDDGSIWSRLRLRVPRDGEISNGWRRVKLIRNTFGYHAFKCWYNGKLIQLLVHQLVLEAFVGPRPQGMFACHDDGNPANNRLENLRWDTPAANSADKVRHGTWPGGSRNGNSKLREEDIREIRAMASRGSHHQSIADHFGVTRTMIRFIVTRKNWSHVT